MQEKVYRSLGTVGAGNIVIGVIMIAVGVTCGIISIIGGARLFKNQKYLTF
nr:hypothetical protein [uncultured Sellimonas sp.]